MFHMFDQQKYQILFCLPNVVNCWGDKTFPRKSWYFIVTAQALYYKDEFVFLNRLWGCEDCQLFRPRFQKSATEFILPFGMKCFEGFLKGSMVIQNPYIVFIIPRILKTNVSQKVQWWGTTCSLEDDLASNHDANTSSLSPKWMRTPYVMEI